MARVEPPPSLGGRLPYRQFCVEPTWHDSCLASLHVMNIDSERRIVRSGTRRHLHPLDRGHGATGVGIRLARDPGLPGHGRRTTESSLATCGDGVMTTNQEPSRVDLAQQLATVAHVDAPYADYS